jgi:hypothetical protein
MLAFDLMSTHEKRSERIPAVNSCSVVDHSLLRRTAFAKLDEPARRMASEDAKELRDD